MDRPVSTSPIDKLVWEACRADDQAMLCNLLEKGGKPNWYPEQALSKNTSPIHSLVKIETPSTNPVSCLCMASKNGNSNMLKMLIKHGADVNKPGTPDMKTPLHIAAEEGNLRLVRQLLKSAADVDKVDHQGETALHKAATNNFLKITKELVEAGADKNATNKAGLTPLHAAVQLGHKNVAAELIKAGADRNISDCQGITPLKCAVGKEYSSIALLLTKGDLSWDNVDLGDFQQILQYRQTCSGIQSVSDAKWAGLIAIGAGFCCWAALAYLGIHIRALRK